MAISHDVEQEEDEKENEGLLYIDNFYNALIRI